jgi:acetyl-CoA carboxylase biotin carboxylase subunit
MAKDTFDKVLVANRGEIAIRISRTLRELGLGAVAVYSEADRAALHVAYADEAYLIGPAPAAESYLKIETLVETALRAGAGAVHPGYGFLAENAAFARAVEAAGLVWIGPPPEAIELMGSKTRARQAMRAAGVPIIPGTTDPVGSVEELLALGDEIGYPLLIKAAAGGGGKGMEEVHAAADAERAFETAQRQGQSYFASPDVYVEKLIVDPRHVEVQVLADAHGNVIHLGERDCTIQRRHQKLIEESPSPALDDELREEMEAAAERACKHIGYRNAGTFEFLVGPDGSFSFIELNARLQVEHPVTELVTGIDIVREQVRIAAGERLAHGGRAGPRTGHAIELRINAEDPARGFAPAPGLIERFRPPLGPGVRVDTFVEEGTTISPYYDSLIAKLIVVDASRRLAIARARRALSEFEIVGVPTTRDVLDDILGSDEFASGEYSTSFLEEAGARLPALAGS